MMPLTKSNLCSWLQTSAHSGCVYVAELLKELTKRELEKKILPDPDIDAFIKVSKTGKPT
jgi:hypothetical protein